jgi:hypothetical protein
LSQSAQPNTFFLCSLLFSDAVKRIHAAAMQPSALFIDCEKFNLSSAAIARLLVRGSKAALH